ncbi:hypothetical protein JW756_02210 [Candidatus Woesearchaeota archaeon]|nr:hypothetical protein [Candidatus Woesearchaeota archaeon]
MLKKKLLKNKRGEALHIGFTMVYLIIFAVILIVMAFVLVLTTQRYIDGFLAYDQNIPKHIYAYRAINNCLAYQDPVTLRYYPGVIDFTKYKQEVLDNCYANTDVKSFNIQLKDLSRQQDYDRILVGFGASLSTKSYPVWIKYEDGSTSTGELLFGVSS